MGRCWECEAAIYQPIIVVLPPTSRGVRQFPVCQPCYRRLWLPLIGEAPNELAPGIGLGADPRRPAAYMARY